MKFYAEIASVGVILFAACRIVTNDGETRPPIRCTYRVNNVGEVACLGIRNVPDSYKTEIQEGCGEHMTYVREVDYSVEAGECEARDWNRVCTYPPLADGIILFGFYSTARLNEEALGQVRRDCETQGGVFGNI